MPWPSNAAIKDGKKVYLGFSIPVLGRKQGGNAPDKCPCPKPYTSTACGITYPTAYARHYLKRILIALNSCSQNTLFQ